MSSARVRGSKVPAAIAAMLVIGVLGAGCELQMEPAADRSGEGRDRDRAPRDGDRVQPIGADDAPPKAKRRPRQEQRPVEDPERAYLVVRVVDGDTLELGNGETVRLVGIDTPEVGECGFEESAARLGELVAGQAVTLAESDEDRDQYGRLLRYVDLGAMDAGYRLIREGLASARYDSRDGYGRHPREDAYIAADRRAADLACPAEPRNFADTDGGGSCERGYSPCVPLYPPDLDCADTGPVSVTGPDPHGLDADGDGLACGGD